MYIKISIALFWLEVISLTMLRANDISMVYPKDKPALLTEEVILLPDTVFSAKNGSMDQIGFGETDSVNMPFGMKLKEIVPGSITVINPSDLRMFDNNTSVYDAISSRVPGFMGGFNLHGLGEALVVIDGIPRPLSSVSIEEIEQITVIKDVNAANLYGVQGRNGLILIKTKRGKANNRFVSLNVTRGFSKPVSLPKFLGSAEYMELFNEARANDGLSSLYSQTLIDGTRSGDHPEVYPDADYYNSDFLKSIKPSTRAVVEFSGGNSNAQYYLNAGLGQSGTLLNMGEGKNDKDTRLNLRSNINFRVNSFITSFVDLVVVYNISRRSNSNYWSNASTLRPNLYPPLIDTALVINKNYTNTARLINGQYMLGGKTGYVNNLWGNLYFGGYNNDYSSAIQFNNGINFDFNSLIKGLTLKTFFALDFYNQFTETQTNTYAVYSPVYGGTNNESILSVTKIGIDKFTGTQGVSSGSQGRNYGGYLTLDYNRRFGEKHALSASLLGYAELYNLTGVAQRDKNSHLGMSINYAYDSKYIVDFNSTLVSSAKLSGSNRLGLSPSVGLAWLLSKENFLKNSSVVDYLKLRVSAGKLNTDLSIPGYYLYKAQYVSGTSFSINELRSVTSTRYSIVDNPDLFYEVRKNMNLGAEAVLFKGSLWVEANLFQENITDIVVQRVNAVPDYLGGFYSYENYGTKSYKGIEFGATLRKSVTNDFGFELGGNMTFLKTEVVKADENYAFDYQKRTGKPVPAIFGLEALGLFQDAADIAGSPVQSFGSVSPGDIKYKDQNGDNVINAQDEVKIGESTPNFVGALNLTLRYKNFSLFAIASERSGIKGYYNSNYYWVYGDLKYSDVVRNRWTPATASTATYPRLTSQANSNNSRASTFWLYDLSKIAIDRLQLTYNIPNNLSSKLSIKNLDLYVRASNIATFAKNSDKMQLNIGSEPQYRYYEVGLKTNF